MPTHLVQAGSETVEELSKFHSQHGLEGFQLKPLDVASILRVVLGNDGVRVFHVSGHMPIESIKGEDLPVRLSLPCTMRLGESFLFSLSSLRGELWLVKYIIALARTKTHRLNPVPINPTFVRDSRSQHA